MASTRSRAAGLAAAAAVLASAARPPRPRGDEHPSFAFAIGNGTLDGPTPRRSASAMRPSTWSSSTARRRAPASRSDPGRGRDLLGYLSVGTIEKWRPLVRRSSSATGSRAWQDWKDEWFADTSKAGYRRKLVEIAEDEILDKGFDGLFLDNVDMVEVKQPQARSARAWASSSRRCSSCARRRRRLLFAQNGAPGRARGLPGPGRRPADRPPRRLEPRGRHLDLRLRPPPLRQELATPTARTPLTSSQEIGDAGPDDDRHRLRRRSPIDTTPSARPSTNALGVGALPYLGDIGLTRVDAVDPPAC